MTNQIYQWKFHFVSQSPLRIGAGQSEITVDFDGKPVLPGTSWAGACREFVEQTYGHKWANQLFGNNETRNQSDILQFSDGVCQTEQPFDIRTGIAIDSFSRTAKRNHLFERVTLSPGVVFSAQLLFKTHVLSNSHGKNQGKFEIVTSILQALHDGTIRLGAYKSIGGGKFTIQNCQYIHYDCSKEEGLNHYVNQTGEPSNWQFSKSIMHKNRINISLRGETASPLLIGGQYPNDSEKPDRTFMMARFNGKDTPIIPASTFKGVLRNRIERIANILQLNDKKTYITSLFGSDAEAKEGQKGRLLLEDIIIQVDDQRDRKTYNRIAINPLTGGVKDGALLDEETIMGSFETNFTYQMNDKSVERVSLKLLLFALRDLALQQFSIGSGATIGRGMLAIQSIKISDGEREIIIDHDKKQIHDPSKWLEELQQEGNVPSYME